MWWFIILIYSMSEIHSRGIFSTQSQQLNLFISSTWDNKQTFFTHAQMLAQIGLWACPRGPSRPWAWSVLSLDLRTNYAARKRKTEQSKVNLFLGTKCKIFPWIDEKDYYHHSQGPSCLQTKHARTCTPTFNTILVRLLNNVWCT